MTERGSTAGLAIAAVAVVSLLVWGGLRVFGDAPNEEGTQNQQAQVESRVDGYSGGTARSFLVFDSNFAYSGDTVYYRSGTTPAGEPRYEPLRLASPEAFRKIGSVSPQPHVPPAVSHAGGGSSGASNPLVVYGGSSNSTIVAQGGENSSGASPEQSSLGSAQGDGGAYTVWYYSDGEYVYVIVEGPGGTSAPQIVPGADPDTFEILNTEYVADDNHVYVIIVSCAGNSCTVVVSIVESADPDTFQVFANAQEIMNANCSGTVTADAQDQNYVYNNGQIVDGISVYLIGAGGDCSDTPVLISP